MERGGAGALAISRERQREVPQMLQEVGKGGRAVAIQRRRELLGALPEYSFELTTTASRPIALAAALGARGALTQKAERFFGLGDDRHALSNATYTAQLDDQVVVGI